MVGVVDFAAEQQLRPVHQSRAARDRAEQIVAGVVPHDLDDAIAGLPFAPGGPEGFLAVDDVGAQRRVLHQRPADGTDLLVVEVATLDEVAVLPEARFVLGAEVGVLHARM